ncbi:MAG: methyltransferase domain-containing protein [bacterium]|nr:methyltransferase domain-containing protein [bacterium]
MENYYDDKYKQNGFYWGNTPSKICYKALELLPPVKPLKLLVIGCGEGRNAIFFARNGYQVTAFDLSANGVEKTKRMAEEAKVSVNVFQADINEYRLTDNYDILFSTGALHYIPLEKRSEIFDDYKNHTNIDGLHVFSVFVKKPFIGKSPESETTAQKWISGELFTHYHDWEVDYCTEEIFDCMSSGIPHKHATNRIVARNITSLATC